MEGMVSEGFYDSRMKCKVRAIDYFEDGLMIATPDGHYPDMSGVIAVAEFVVPGVIRVVVFVGQRPDLEYKLEDGEWVAREYICKQIKVPVH